MTVETPDQVERPADDQAGHPRRTIDDWQRDMTANLNRMATDEQYRCEVRHVQLAGHGCVNRAVILGAVPLGH